MNILTSILGKTRRDREGNKIQYPRYSKRIEENKEDIEINI